MSIHPISVTVISGQENAAEIVFAACSFLKMSYAYTVPVSKSKDVRDEFLLSFHVYRIRESFDYIPEHEYINRIHILKRDGFPQSTFCLALDVQGYSIAKELLTRNGIMPNQIVHDNICSLNVVEKVIPPYPRIKSTVEYWKKIRSELYRVEWEHRRVRSKNGKRKLFDIYVPASSREKTFYAWYKNLEEILLPWRHNMGKILADWS